MVCVAPGQDPPVSENVTLFGNHYIVALHLQLRQFSTPLFHRCQPKSLAVKQIGFLHSFAAEEIYFASSVAENSTFRP